MIERVLVPMDDSEMADRALEYAIEVHPDATITAFHVVGEPSPMMGKAMGLVLDDDIEAVSEQLAASVLDRARAIAADHDVEIQTAIGHGSPAKAILRRADSVDQVVLGSHGGSLADRLLVGNVAERVVRRSPTPVTVVR